MTQKTLNTITVIVFIILSIISMGGSYFGRYGDLHEYQHEQREP